jgi:mRNA interferase MazF
MTTIKGGEFWVAKILFTDGTSSKKRPVLILWVDGDDVVVTAVTSAMPRTQTDILLKDWVNSGLRVPSTVRLSRLDCLEKNLLLAKLGRISSEDAVYLLKAWDNYIKPQF